MANESVNQSAASFDFDEWLHNYYFNPQPNVVPQCLDNLHRSGIRLSRPEEK